MRLCLRCAIALGICTLNVRSDNFSGTLGEAGSKVGKFFPILIGRSLLLRFSQSSVVAFTYSCQTARDFVCLLPTVKLTIETEPRGSIVTDDAINKSHNWELSKLCQSRLLI